MWLRMSTAIITTIYHPAGPNSPGTPSFHPSPSITLKLYSAFVASGFPILGVEFSYILTLGLLISTSVSWKKEGQSIHLWGYNFPILNLNFAACHPQKGSKDTTGSPGKREG